MNLSRTRITKNCTGCGTCLSVCSFGALELVELKGYFVVEKDTLKCTQCGLCMQVCPQLNESPSYTGKPLEVYKAYSRDDNIRYRATSGGIITTLLMEMISKGDIESALVVHPVRNGNSISFSPMWIDSNESAKENAGSVYQPICLNRELRNISRYEKVAIVGLPCHIRGLRNFLAINPELNERVFISIGLTCSHNVSKEATKFLVKSLHLSSVNDLSYRGNGWPGGVTIKSGGKSYFFHNNDSLWFDIFSSYVFCTPYCLSCRDDLSELSDLNVSDAWLKEELAQTNNPGTSIVALWTKKGIQVFERYRYAFILEKLNHSDLIRSQASPLFLKKHIFADSSRISYRQFHNLLKAISYVSLSVYFKLLPLTIQKLYILLSKKLVHKFLYLLMRSQDHRQVPSD